MGLNYFVKLLHTWHRLADYGIESNVIVTRGRGGRTVADAPALVAAAPHRDARVVRHAPYLVSDLGLWVSGGEETNTKG